MGKKDNERDYNVVGALPPTYETNLTREQAEQRLQEYDQRQKEILESVRLGWLARKDR